MCLVKIYTFLKWIIKTSGFKNTAATIVKTCQGSLVL